MKKMLAILLVFVLVFTMFSACGGGGADPSQSEGTEATIPELETASQLGAVAVQGYVYARMLLDNVVATDIETADKTELATLLAETIAAWEAVDDVCGKMGEFADEAQVAKAPQTFAAFIAARHILGDGLPFISEVYAADEDMTAWAENINNMYNMTDKNLRTKDRFKQLSEQLGTDARSAIKQLQMANEILSGEYTAEGDYFKAWESAAMATKTACKIGLFVGGIIASGGTIGAAGITLMGGETALGTAAVVGGFVVGGADCMVDVANTGSNIFLGDQHVATKYFQGIADDIAPVSTAFNIANLGGATAGEVLSLVGENIVSLYEDGKVGGVTVSKPAKSYLPSEEEQPKPEYYIDVAGKTEEEAIAAIEEAGGPTLPAENSVTVESWLDYLDITAEDIIAMASEIYAAAEAITEEPAGEPVGDLPIPPGTYTATPQLADTTYYTDVYDITEKISCTDITLTIGKDESVSLSYNYGKLGTKFGENVGYNLTDDTTLEFDMPVNIENISLSKHGKEYKASGEHGVVMKGRTTVISRSEAIFDNEGNEVLPAKADVYDSSKEHEGTISYEITLTEKSFSGTITQATPESKHIYNIITFSGEF